MYNQASFAAFLRLADKVYAGEAKRNELFDLILGLPPIDLELLDALADQAESAALAQPRLGWAICEVAEIASRRQHCALFTRSMAAWYLGRAANNWVQPQKAQKAIARARNGFVRLNEPGWVAACAWQANALPWLSADLKKSEEELKRCLTEFDISAFKKFVPLCGLTLAQTQNVLEKFAEAESTVKVCEDHFGLNKDDINLARCWLIRANILRRRNCFQEAIRYFEKAEGTFTRLSARPDIGMLNYYYGLTLLFSSTDFNLVANKFEKAIQLFVDCDLGLWQGMCLTFYGVANMQNGELKKASSCYEKAERIFKKFEANGLLAESLTAHGRLNTLMGHADQSIEQLVQAKTIHEKQGRFLSASIDATNIGEAFFQQGRYQDALHSFESAQDNLIEQDDKVRIGLHYLFTAHFWMQLNDHSRARAQLDLAESYLKVSNQFDSLISINNTRAKLFFDEKEFSKAQSYLQDSLEIAEKENLLPQIALTQLNLGEILAASLELTEASTMFNRALDSFKKMGLSSDYISCLISLGNCSAEKKKAKKYFLKSLHISQGLFPEQEWRAYAGLANLEPSPMALKYYRLAVQTLAKIRSNFWQPGLASFYAQTPASFFSRAISFAAANSDAQDTLAFIEADKANSSIQQLLAPMAPGTNKKFDQLEEVRAEINWLKMQLEFQHKSGFSIKNDLESRSLRIQLQEKSTRYDELLSRLERNSSTNYAGALLVNFSLEKFRKLAIDHLGTDWMAQDFYISGGKLFIVSITPDKYAVIVSPLTARFLQALHTCQNCRQESRVPLSKDLSTLGDFLFPDEIRSQLSPETTLILAPHQDLHGLPWAGLGRSPLVLQCIPVIVPSLNFLQILWERTDQKMVTSVYKGLLLGISEFSGRHKDLPYVREELELLQRIFAGECERLPEEEITFAKLLEMRREKFGLAPYDWLHVATHFFSDVQSGRLSGIALKQEDIFLDQLRDLAPLPPLMTLSGCSGLYSRIYAGDEQISLSNTCFLSGAQSIMGSVWPILDQSAAALMADFYLNQRKYRRPSLALAETQRKKIHSGEDISAWCSFCCLGVP